MSRALVRFLPWLACVLILISSKTSAQNCQAAFSYSINGYVAEFTNASSGYGAHWTCWWNFGDYTYSGRPNPKHAFTNPGKYKVCLLIYDSTTSCQSTWCDTLEIKAQSPGCNADFSIEQDLMRVAFYPLCTGIQSSATYTWDFGDGSSSSLSSPDHTYLRDGIYYAKLSVNSSSCTDSINQTIIIHDATPCKAAFDAKVAYDSVSFRHDTTHRFAQYDWDFGDGNKYRGAFPVHHYLMNGSYLVKHAVTDTFNQCSDTYTDTVIINQLPSCRAGFDETTVDRSAFFTSTSTGALKYYYWDFGDGSTSWDRNPTHTYAKYGKYKVYHYVSDSLYQCTSSITQNVELFFPSKFGSISGKITVNFKEIESACVWLMVKDVASNHFSVIDTFIVDSNSAGNYYFDNIPAGVYLIKAAPGFSSKYRFTHSPTYSGQKLTWDKATLLYLNTNPILQDIELLPFNFIPGSNRINGRIIEDPNRFSGQVIGVGGMQVNVLTDKGVLVQTVWTGLDGFFYCDSLGKGVFQIWPEYPGKSTVACVRQFVQMGQQVDSVLMMVKTSEIVSATENALSSFWDEDNALSVYPNPSKGLVTVTWPLDFEPSVLIVYNAVGQFVTEVNCRGNSHLQLFTQEMNNGIYFGVLKGTNRSKLFRFVVSE